MHYVHLNTIFDIIKIKIKIYDVIVEIFENVIFVK